MGFYFKNTSGCEGSLLFFEDSLFVYFLSVVGVCVGGLDARKRGGLDDRKDLVPKVIFRDLASYIHNTRLAETVSWAFIGQYTCGTPLMNRIRQRPIG